jgi:hypothetical protein
MNQSKISVFALAGLLVAGSAVAAPSKSAGVSGISGEPRGGLLYSQLDNAAGNGAPDQDFEAAFDGYDAEAADDFDVNYPDGWDVTEITTVGTLSAGGTGAGATVDVAFFTNAAGLPGTAVCTYAAVVPVSVAGSHTITLPTPCHLETGLHWMVLQTNQVFTVAGQHFWSNRTTALNNQSLWRNPGDGFATGCTDWTPQQTCGVGGGLGQDFLFSIGGTLGVPDDVPVVEVPTMNWTGLGALVALLGLVGFAVLRRQA